MNAHVRYVRCLAAVLLLLAAAGAAQAQEEAAAAADTAAPVLEAAAADTAATAPAEARVTFEFGTGLDRATRTIVDPGTEFAPEVGEIWCLTRIDGLNAPTSVTHAWYHEGETRARVDLPVGSASWRTWSSKRILPAWTGRWEVRVLDAAGTVLGSGEFTVR